MRRILSRLLFKVLRYISTDVSVSLDGPQAFSVPPPHDPMWERVRQRLVRGEFPSKRHRLTVYAMDTSGSRVVLRCVDIDEEFFLADITVDADLLTKLLRIANIALTPQSGGSDDAIQQ